MNKLDGIAKNGTELFYSHLKSLSINITKSMTNTEAQFIEMGRSLQNIYSQSGNLIKGITGAAERLNAKSDDNMIQVIETSIDDVLSELSEYPVKISSSMDHINKSSQHLEDLIKLCQNLKTISRFLNAVGLNIHIEGCRSKEALEMFDGFGEEIKDLSVRINRITEKIYTDSAKALSDQASGVFDIRKRMAVINDLTCEARQAVTKTIDNIQRLADQSIMTLEQAQKTAHTIQEMIGEIVMAIQFHDIARQKLEHVISAFEDVARLLKEKTPSVVIHKDGDTKIHFQVVSILNVQYEQLLHVIKEIKQAHEKIKQSFDQIDREVSSLKHLLNESGPSENKTCSLESEFASIMRRMEDLKQIQDQGRSLGSEMVKTIKESSDVVAVLSQYAGRIDDMNTGIKHKALNAIIMTGRLGKKGLTLEVLAQEVRHISVDCTGLVEESLKSLEAISGIAKLLTTGQDKDAFEKKSLNEGIQEISMALEDHKSDSDSVSQVAQDLEAKIDVAGQGLAFLPVWTAHLEQEVEAMDVLMSSVSPLVDADTKENSGHVEELFARYTMESERIIHDRISGEKNPSTPSDSDLEQETIKELTDAKANEIEEEFDDNIELF